MTSEERRIRERGAVCDDGDTEFVRRQEQQEAEFPERQEQQSKREAEFLEQQSKEEADFVKRREQQRLELAASLNAREVAVERREAASDNREIEEARVEAVAPQRREAASDEREREEARVEAVTPQRQGRQRRGAASNKREREEARVEVVSPQRQARQEAASATRAELGHRTGALLDASQSRDILLLYFGLVESGMRENPAAKRTAELLRVGKGKVFKVNTLPVRRTSMMPVMRYLVLVRSIFIRNFQHDHF